MNRFRNRALLVMLAMLASGGLVISGCSGDDNGSSSETGDGSAEAGETADGAADGTIGHDAGDATVATPDAKSENDAPVPEAGAEASTVVDGGVDALAPMPDASDGSVPTADAANEAATDAGLGAVADAGGDVSVSPVAEAGVDDASFDAKAMDATPTEADAADAETADAVGDATIADSGGDAGVDSGPQTTFSVIATSLSEDCANDVMDGTCVDTQCEDLSGSTGPETNTQLCLDTLGCAINGSSAPPFCGFLMDVPNECYCGDAASLACQGGAADGVCLTAEQNGFGSADPGVILPGFTDESTPSGVANFIVNCLTMTPRCERVVTGP